MTVAEPASTITAPVPSGRASRWLANLPQVHMALSAEFGFKTGFANSQCRFEDARGLPENWFRRVGRG